MPAKKKAPGVLRIRASDALLVAGKIAPLVHYFRHEKVILDSDLAELYGIGTKTLNQAVQRNLDRFPAHFMFQLTVMEWENLRSQTVTAKNTHSALRSQSATLKAPHSALRSQNVTLKQGQQRKYLPYAFTEQGVAMLSSALLAEKIDTLEQKYAEHDQPIQLVFEAIKQLISADTAAKAAPTREIGFHAP